MAKKEKSSPGFVLVYMIPLLLYYFASYKIYMGSIDDTTGLQVKDSNPKSKIALLQLGFMVIVFLYTNSSSRFDGLLLLKSALILAINSALLNGFVI